MVAPITIEVEAGLTGKYRVRRGWFGRLVLQCECHVDRVCGLRRELKVKTIWRDAKAKDVGLDHSGPIQLNT